MQPVKTVTLCPCAAQHASRRPRCSPLVLPAPEPCALVIYGATGDLTHRKLVPALYNLAHEGQLPQSFAVVGFARRPKTHDQFRAELRESSPQPSVWPFLAAIAVGIVFVASIFTPWAVVWGSIPVAVTLIAWFWPKDVPEDEE